MTTYSDFDYEGYEASLKDGKAPFGEPFNATIREAVECYQAIVRDLVQTTEITDAMVEEGGKALWDDNQRVGTSTWPKAADWAKRSYRNKARVVLEAALNHKSALLSREDNIERIKGDT